MRSVILLVCHLLQEIEQVHKQDKFHMETLHEKQVKFLSIIHVHRSGIEPDKTLRVINTNSQAREPLCSNTAVIVWWLQSTNAQNRVPSC